MILEDKDLIAQALEPDTAQAAFNELSDRYSEKLYIVMMYWTCDPDIANELCQETWIKFSNYLPSFKQEASVFTLLHRIAYTCWIDYVRKKSREPDTVPMYKDYSDSTEFLDSLINSAEKNDSIDSFEEEEYVLHYLDKLPPESRDILIMREYNGLSYKEIADKLDCSIGTVKSRLSRAKESLKGLVKVD